MTCSVEADLVVSPVVSVESLLRRRRGLGSDLARAMGRGRRGLGFFGELLDRAWRFGWALPSAGLFLGFRVRDDLACRCFGEGGVGEGFISVAPFLCEVGVF